MGTGAVAPSVRSERPTFGKPEGVAISHTGVTFRVRSPVAPKALRRRIARPSTPVNGGRFCAPDRRDAQVLLSAQHPLHKNQIEPAFEFPADFAKVRHWLEPSFSMESQAGFIGSINSSHHGVITCGLGGV